MDHNNLEPEKNNQSEAIRKENQEKDETYKELSISKMIVNGKEQNGNMILADMTKDRQIINVTVYTKEVETKADHNDGH